MAVLTFALVMLLLSTALWPSLPLSKTVISSMADVSIWLQNKITVGRGLVAISVTMLLFVAFWAVQGDAPMLVTMVLPELAAWLSTFEIATLVEATVGLGWAALALRATGRVTLWRGNLRSHRRRQRKAAKKPSNANDDDRTMRLAVAA